MKNRLFGVLYYTLENGRVTAGNKTLNGRIKTEQYKYALKKLGNK